MRARENIVPQAPWLGPWATKCVQPGCAQRGADRSSGASPLTMPDECPSRLGAIRARARRDRGPDVNRLFHPAPLALLVALLLLAASLPTVGASPSRMFDAGMDLVASSKKANAKKALSVAKKADKRSKKALKLAQAAKNQTGPEAPRARHGAAGPAGSRPCRSPGAGRYRRYPGRSITQDKLADNAVISTKVAANTLVAADIATGAVETTEILDSTIAARRHRGRHDHRRRPGRRCGRLLGARRQRGRQRPRSWRTPSPLPSSPTTHVALEQDPRLIRVTSRRHPQRHDRRGRHRHGRRRIGRDRRRGSSRDRTR